MSVVGSCNLNNPLTIDSFNKNNSSATEQSNKTPTVAQRAISLAYQTVIAPVNFTGNLFKGAAVWTGVEAFISQGESLKILYNAFFSTNCIKSHFGFTSMKILSANQYVAKAAVIEAIIFREILFRGLVQDVILKQGVKKAVSLISPKHTELVDSKAYTAARILVTSALYSYYCSGNYYDKNPISNFLYGIGFGLMKERFGLASAIGAHMLNAFVPMASDLSGTCKS